MAVAHLHEVDAWIGLLDSAIRVVLKSQRDLLLSVISKCAPQRQVISEIERRAEAPIFIVEDRREHIDAYPDFSKPPPRFVAPAVPHHRPGTAPRWATQGSPPPPSSFTHHRHTHPSTNPDMPPFASLWHQAGPQAPPAGTVRVRLPSPSCRNPALSGRPLVRILVTC